MGLAIPHIPVLHPEGLAAPLPQRAIWATVQHPVPPAEHHRHGIPQHENEEDWYRAYGSAIIQGHTKLKDAIQAAQKVHSNGGECRRFLLNEALATK
ncbi:hypothetical protein SCLCIDRAFT_34614 [Scleroderma citrinum Foug A]|uniref:Uncharacterized protein n=1 Tax=Scleroderma citrinum Foug A TaxID=1036808 RepID=A0A0C2YK59_9AGAM|nr:hypothetical protein SCLCIDRAFT_34614 [Scleroderma citrinum Foug A]